MALEDADSSLIKNKKFMLELIKLHPRREYEDLNNILTYVSDSLKKDKKFIIEVIKQDFFTLEDIDESLRNDPDILAIINKKK